jgi:hypothetical protein
MTEGELLFELRVGQVWEGYSGRRVTIAGIDGTFVNFAEPGTPSGAQIHLFLSDPGYRLVADPSVPSQYTSVMPKEPWERK